MSAPSGWRTPASVLWLQRAAGNQAVAALVAGRRPPARAVLQRLQIPVPGNKPLDTDDRPNFIAALCEIVSPVELDRIAHVIRTAAPTPLGANDRAALEAVEQQARDVVAINNIVADEEFFLNDLFKRFFHGSIPPEQTMTELGTHKADFDRRLDAWIKASSSPAKRAAIAARQKLATAYGNLNKRIGAYRKTAAAKETPEEHFRGYELSKIVSKTRMGSPAERDALRRRYQELFDALAALAKLSDEELDDIIDSLYRLKDEADPHARAIIVSIPSWTRIKLPGLQADVRKLCRGSLAAWKGIAAELTDAHWELEAGHVEPGELVNLGSFKPMKGGAVSPGALPRQDVDISFTHTDKSKHYHEVKADPAALVSKAKTVQVLSAEVRGKQVVSYGRVREHKKDEPTKAGGQKAPRTIRFVCVSTRGWIILYPQAMQNIADAGMELQLGPALILDARGIMEFYALLAEYDAWLKLNKRTTIWDWARTQNWVKPEDFLCEHAAWKQGATPQLTAAPTVSPPILRTPPTAQGTGLVPGQRALDVVMGGRVLILRRSEVEQSVIAVYGAPDPGPDNGLAIQGASIFVQGLGGQRLARPQDLDPNR